MKRQRDIQQVKEHDICPPNQTKEKEIGSLPEKEFRIMIGRMTQNLEDKMELQINRLETRIEKMQEMFNKDLEEIIAKFRLKLNKVGKAMRPFRYDLNQIPYDYTVEVRNRFKGLDLIDRVPDELWTEVCDIVQRQGLKPSPRKRNAKKQNGCLGRPYK